MLRGVLHAASRPPAPGVVMAHGFSGVKEQIDHYAAAFARRGLTALVFDHRGFGGSDGSPRQDVDPLRQLADWRDALTFAGGLDEIEATRGLGVWGSSFAGGLAMVLAADDARVRCVVAQIPHVSGHANGRELFGPQERTSLASRFAADRVARLNGEDAVTIPVFATAPDELGALPPAVGPRYVDAITEAAPSWRNEVTLRSLEHALTFEPGGWIAHVTPTPLLMIVAAQDVVTFPHHQVAAFAAAHEPKRLVMHPGGHFDTYLEHFDQTSGAAADWFAEHLTD